MSERKVKSIILAAGKGSRMKSDKPKVLHSIFDKPLIAYVLDAVNNTGCTCGCFVITGHGHEETESFINKNYNNTKCILQQEQKGTGDAAAKAAPYLKDFDGSVIILCGDTPLITSETLKDFIEFHNNSSADLTVMSAVFDNPCGFGRIIRNKDNSIAAIIEEKDASNEQKRIKEINSGIYCLNWRSVSPALESLKNDNAQGEYYLTDIVKYAVQNKLKVQSYIIKDNEEIFGINSKQQLAQAFKIMNKKSLLRLFNAGVQIMDEASVYISPETEIGADTIILPNVYITGKNKIGEKCKIGPFSHIRGGTDIGNNVRIGNFVEIKNSVIKDNTNVSHLSYIGDSDLGCGVNIGAGTITANYNHITKEKKRAVIKDGAGIGANSVLIAPVTIGENVSAGALSVITKDIEAGALALTRAPLKVIKGWAEEKLKQFQALKGRD